MKRLPSLRAKVVGLAVSSLLSAAAFADTTFVTDQGHTEVMFGWNHAGVTRQHGEFTVATGTLTLADNIEDSSISVEIDATSVSSGFGPLDDHLKSEDFLEVAKYPTLTFESTSVKSTGEKTMDVTGDMTIHGVTLPVTFKAEMSINGEHPLGKSFDYYKGEWVGITATTEIDHVAFGVGGFSTGPIAITINSEMKAPE